VAEKGVGMGLMRIHPENGGAEWGIYDSSDEAVFYVVFVHA
jgi:hypothetical protein